VHTTLPELDIFLFPLLVDVVAVDLNFPTKYKSHCAMLRKLKNMIVMFKKIMNIPNLKENI
jgi:hypothetical protein